MRKKNYSPNSDHEENEFDVDEPEEIQNNASDDDWTPEKDTSGGRRTSNRLRNIPKSRAPIIDASSSDEEEDGSDSGAGNKRKGKGRGRGRQPAKKHKVSSTSSTPAKVKTENDMGGTKSVISDSEPSSTTANNTASSVTITPNIVKVNKDFTSGAFIVLKSDVAKLDEDPPLWKIDGKALLQKYVAFEQDGQTLYKNTSVYSGWTINNKDNYYPVSVIFKQQTRKDHIIEFKRDQIKMKEENDSPEVSSSVPEVDPLAPDPFAISSEVTTTTNFNAVQVKIEPKIEPTLLEETGPSTVPVVRPLIKVKSFAIVPQEESVIHKPLADKSPSITTEITPPAHKINKNYASGSFLVLKTEAANVDPPLWKIDGKSLLQKYCAFKENGKTLYKNTAEYSGWSITTKSTYHPVSVIFKLQNKKEHIVQLEKIKWDEPDDDS